MIRFHICCCRKMLNTCILLLFASNIFAYQAPQVIIDVTHDIDGFIKQNKSQHSDNIGRVLNYTLNIQYTTYHGIEEIENILTNISAVLSNVCSQSKMFNCTLGEIGLYIFYPGIWSKFLYGETNESDRGNLNFIHRNQHKFKICAISFGAENNADSLRLLEQLDKVVKPSGFELGYNFDHDNSTADFKFESVDQIKSFHAVFNNFFHFHSISFPNNLPESFSMFEEFFVEKLKFFSTINQLYSEYTDGRVPNLYIAVELVTADSTSEVSSKIITEYSKLLLQFVNTLMKKSNVSVVISGVAIPNEFSQRDVVSESVIGENVFPATWMPAEYIHAAELLPFQTFIVSGLEWIRDIERKVGKEELRDDSNGFKSVLVDLSDSIDANYNDIEKLVASNQSIAKAIGVQVTSLLFSPQGLEKLRKEKLSSNTHFFHNSEFQLGIKIELGNLEEYKTGSLNHHFKGVEAAVALFQFYIPYIGIFSLSEVNKHKLCHLYIWNKGHLISFYEDWKRYEQVHPNTKLIIYLTEFNPATYSLFPSCEGRAYCDTCFVTIDKFYEGLMTWAKIHEVTIVLKRAISTHKDLFVSGSAWYEYLIGVPDEFLVSRCQPLKLKDETNDCIHRTKSVPAEGIRFHSLSGITVNGRIYNAQNQSLNPDELRLMTAFAFSKFKLVELLVEQDGECNVASNVEKALKKLKAHVFRNGSPARLFLQFSLLPVEKTPIPVQRSCYENLTKTVSNVLNKQTTLAGVHISELQTAEKLNDIRTGTKSLNVSLGMTSYNCYKIFSQEVSVCHTPLDQLDYIVCVFLIEKASNTNRAKMSEQMDKVLYISKKIRKMCSHIQVYFRLTVSNKNKKSRKNTSNKSLKSFIQYLGDWSKFTSKYHIPIFLAETVDHFNGDANGWWFVSNWTNLANPQIYFEKQAEVLNQATLRPSFLKLPGPKIPEREIPAPTNVVGISVATAVVTVTTVTVVVLAALKFWLRTRRVLTKEEVQAILDGDNTHFSTEMMLLTEQEGNAIYDQAYEISKSKFIFDEEIPLGSGHFGDVVKARLGDDFVAVKKPNETCTRQGLMGMLEEVRILSRVGTQEHVLRFIGASTKHASTGVIYIATELCENGCLEKFLKNLGSSMENDGMNDMDMTLNLHQLNQFSFEIASGMEYISSKRIIHRDLATRNVLLDSHMTCKLGDFGLSRKLYVDDLYEKRGKDPMPWRWLADESLQRREYSSASDVWSYGITVWEIFSFAKLPYFEITSAVGFGDLIQNGLRLNCPPILPQSTFSTVRECWNSESGQRPSFTQLKEFFKEILSQIYSGNADI